MITYNCSTLNKITQFWFVESSTKKIADIRFAISSKDWIQNLTEKASNDNTKKHTDLGQCVA